MGCLYPKPQRRRCTRLPSHFPGKAARIQGTESGKEERGRGQGWESIPGDSELLESAAGHAQELLGSSFLAAPLCLLLSHFFSLTALLWLLLSGFSTPGAAQLGAAPEQQP